MTELFCFFAGVLDEDSRKHLLVPDTSFIIEQERNVKWWGHLMSREEELMETSPIWFSRRSSTKLGPRILFVCKASLHMGWSVCMVVGQRKRSTELGVCRKGNESHLRRGMCGYCTPQKGINILNLSQSADNEFMYTKLRDTFRGWKPTLVKSKKMAVSTGNVSQGWKKTPKSICVCWFYSTYWFLLYRGAPKLNYHY